MLEVAFGALVALDVGQTSYGIRNGSAESNPLFGSRRPPPWKLTLFPLVGVAAHAGVATLLPRELRRLWQGIGIGVEISTVASNARYVGFRLAAPW